jgi:hypothetical protein
MVAGLALSGCGGETVVEKSFTDKHGRVCTYVMIKEKYGNRDVGNISCEYPPSPVPTAPTGTTAPSAPAGPTPR